LGRVPSSHLGILPQSPARNPLPSSDLRHRSAPCPSRPSSTPAPNFQPAPRFDPHPSLVFFSLAWEPVEILRCAALRRFLGLCKARRVSIPLVGL